MSSPELYSNEKNNLVSRVVANVKNEAQSLEAAVVKALMDELVKRSSSGKLDDGISNLRVLRSIRRILSEQVSQSAVSNVSTILPQFERMFELNARMHAGVNDLELEPNDFRRLRTAFADLMVDELIDTAESAELIVPIRNVITRNILSGATLSRTEDDLMRTLTSRGEGTGKLQARVTQITRDSMYGFDGAVNKQVADRFDMNAYMYVGSLIKDSRPQCKRWVEKRELLKSELPAEIAWAKRNGSGMRPTTTAETFPIDRGGYNCRHEAIPIRKN